MEIIALSPNEQQSRLARKSKVHQLQVNGICPTCQQLREGDVYSPPGDLAFFEDDLFLCLLEHYPRNPGHTIIIVKPHFEDVVQLPPDLYHIVYRMIHTTMRVLKHVLAPEKIYLCTMCDGKRNHLHYQLIPRFAGDKVCGSRLFLKERKLLVSGGTDLAKLREAMQRAVELLSD